MTRPRFGRLAGTCSPSQSAAYTDQGPMAMTTSSAGPRAWARGILERQAKLSLDSLRILMSEDQDSQRSLSMSGQKKVGIKMKGRCKRQPQPQRGAVLHKGRCLGVWRMTEVEVSNRAHTKSCPSKRKPHPRKARKSKHCMLITGRRRAAPCGGRACHPRSRRALGARRTGFCQRRLGLAVDGSGAK